MRPRRVRIGHTVWTMKWSKAAVDELVHIKDSASGAASHRFSTIAVEPLPESPVLEREVALHEVLHACFQATGMKWSEEREEAFVAGLSPVLLAALRDNPSLVRYLTG